MRDYRKHFPVNWIDGMKVSKNHFIDQDNAWAAGLQDMAALNLSPIRYGVIPASVAGENTFDIKISVDNQESLRVSVLSCQAITSGGIRLSLPAVSTVGQAETGNVLTTTFPFSSANTDSTWWIFLLVHPYEKQPAGSPDLSENPPRFPIVVPSYTLKLVSESNYKEFAHHPYALAIGKVYVNGKDIKIDHEYIPPCFSVNAHPDLLSLHGELDRFLSDIELFSSQIVQKTYKKTKPNDISELVLFLCDRIMQYLAQAIISMRWTLLYESPAIMFASISTLARVLKNTIDLRIGSGKDELMNYLTEWCELKQGELEGMLSNLANTSYNHNDINKSIQKIVLFVKVTTRLFETLSKLEFIDKSKKSDIFLKEESMVESKSQVKPKRWF